MQCLLYSTMITAPWHPKPWQVPAVILGGVQWSFGAEREGGGKTMIATCINICDCPSWSQFHVTLVVTWIIHPCNIVMIEYHNFCSRKFLTSNNGTRSHYFKFCTPNLCFCTHKIEHFCTITYFCWWPPQWYTPLNIVRVGWIWCLLIQASPWPPIMGVAVINVCGR